MRKWIYTNCSVACAIAVMLQGCSPALTNITPPTMPQNSSNKYRFTVKSSITPKDSVLESFKAEIIIDGAKHELKQSALGDSFFFHDHYIPQQYDEATYYFVINYNKSARGNKRTTEIKSPLQKLKITDRTVFSLSTERAPVGSKIAVLGTGFRSGDRVMVGDFSAPTELISSNVLSFIVPQLFANKTYNVYVCHDKYKSFVGAFFADKAGLSVDTSRIEISKGEKTSIVVSTDVPVAVSNLSVNVTTNVPESVIMPEVSIGYGETSTIVNIEGGEVGSGFLFFDAKGYDEVQIPISVKESSNSAGGNLTSINQI